MAKAIKYYDVIAYFNGQQKPAYYVTADTFHKELEKAKKEGCTIVQDFMTRGTTAIATPCRRGYNWFIPVEEWVEVDESKPDFKKEIIDWSKD